MPIIKESILIIVKWLSNCHNYEEFNKISKTKI